MLQAVTYGVIGGVSLILGSMTGVLCKFKQRTIAAFMAFGSGVLICALTFGLMEEAFRHGGFDAIIIGFLLGGLVFIGGDYLLHIAGARKHKRVQLAQPQNTGNGSLITLGAVLDGIPESIALGIALFAGQGTGLLMLIAIFLSNFPESMSSLNGLYKEGFTVKKIFFTWLTVGLITAMVTVLSFLFLNDISLNTIGIIEAFAGGAILAMLADSMMPEAYEDGGFLIGLLTVLGFLTAFLISRL
jgi:zinc transporter, ZIP family